MAAQGKRQDAVDAIVKAVENLDLTAFPEAWNELDVLSTHTQIDGIQVDPAGVSVSGKSFRGVAPVYVVLEYGGQNDDGFTTSDSFLGTFSGHLDEGGRPVVDTFAVDTSPFFAGEEVV